MWKDTYRGALDVDELLRVVARLLRKQRRFDGLICRYLADLADGVVRWPGLLLAYGDVYQLARRRLGLSLRSSRERIRVGRALRELPALFSALMAGDVTYSRVREVTRVARSDTERQWLQAARELSMRHLERCVVAAGGRRDVRAPADSKALDRDGLLVRSLGLPRHVWVLLEAAMKGARSLSSKRLTDAEALESVARAALAQQLCQPKRKGPEFVVSPAPKSTQSGSSDAAGAAPMTTPRDMGGTAGAPMTTPRDIGGTAGAAPMTTQSGSGDGEASAAWSESQTGSVDVAATRQATQSWRVGREPVGPQSVSPRTPVRTSAEGELNERQRSALSPEAEQLLELIQGNRTWNAATLCDETGIAVPRLIKALTDLELSRRVYRDPMGFYEAAPSDPFREAS